VLPPDAETVGSGQEIEAEPVTACWPAAVRAGEEVLAARAPETPGTPEAEPKALRPGDEVLAESDPVTGAGMKLPLAAKLGTLVQAAHAATALRWPDADRLAEFVLAENGPEMPGGVCCALAEMVGTVVEAAKIAVTDCKPDEAIVGFEVVAENTPRRLDPEAARRAAAVLAETVPVVAWKPLATSPSGLVEPLSAPLIPCGMKLPLAEFMTEFVDPVNRPRVWPPRADRNNTSLPRNE
jgi:hypothetical protein